MAAEFKSKSMSATHSSATASLLWPIKPFDSHGSISAFSDDVLDFANLHEAQVNYFEFWPGFRGQVIMARRCSRTGHQDLLD